MILFNLLAFRKSLKIYILSLRWKKSMLIIISKMEGDLPKLSHGRLGEGKGWKQPKLIARS